LLDTIQMAGTATVHGEHELLNTYCPRITPHLQLDVCESIDVAATCKGLVAAAQNVWRRTAPEGPFLTRCCAAEITACLEHVGQPFNRTARRWGRRVGVGTPS